MLALMQLKLLFQEKTSFKEKKRIWWFKARNKSQKYAIPTSDNVLLNERFEGVLRQGFLSCDVAGNILVVKTVSGMAMAVGAAFDSLKWPEIIGAVAGDDTIICVIRTEKEAIVVMSRIRKFVSETPSRDGRDAK